MTHSPTPPPATLWQKDAAPEAWLTRFTAGNDCRWDTLLLPYDAEGTRVHAWGLAQVDVLSAEEYGAIERTLDMLQAQTGRGALEVTPADEDCHTVLEGHLIEHLGEVGEKIHAGRSRNDQVLVALRLFLREHLAGIARHVTEITGVLCDLGNRHARDLMPGYTHMQRAMPTTAGLWALGYAEVLASDVDALRDAHEQINVSPMGSAAGYGVPHLALPWDEMARRLGFRTRQVHAPAVQLSRGKLELHVVHALVQVAATLNRLASDLVLFNTSEFDYVELPEDCCTGSSIMPQKRNPDVLELARASYHRLLAEMQVLLSLPANLPSGYHRDLQLTKEAVMRSTLVGEDVLAALARLLPHLEFRADRMEESCSPEIFATTETMRHVGEGVPFRRAYRQSARALDTLQRPASTDEALAAWKADGSPGQGRADLIREDLKRHHGWIEQEGA